MILFWLSIFLTGHIAYCSGKELIVWENDELNICCGRNELIRIEEAFYGYNSKDCPYESSENANCTAPGTKYLVSYRCSDHQCCKIAVNDKELDANGYCSKTNPKYLKISYRCVRKRNCLNKNEHFSVVASLCQLTCPPITYYFLPCETKPGCVCNDYLVRDHITNECVDPALCPNYDPSNPQLENEYYDECIFKCQERCLNCTEIDPCMYIKERCQPGYKCVEGYCRKDGICQPRLQCPK